MDAEPTAVDPAPSPRLSLSLSLIVSLDAT